MMKTRPINLEQKMLLYLLQDPEILCISVTGISGRGKTLICSDYALAEIKKVITTDLHIPNLLFQLMKVNIWDTTKVDWTINYCRIYNLYFPALNIYTKMKFTN